MARLSRWLNHTARSAPTSNRSFLAKPWMPSLYRGATNYRAWAPFGTLASWTSPAAQAATAPCWRSVTRSATSRCWTPFVNGVHRSPPEPVCEEFSASCKPYGVGSVVSDRWRAKFVTEGMKRYGVFVKQCAKAKRDDVTKKEEPRTESGYNDAFASRRLTRLTSRASLRSDHDRWTARSRWPGRSDHDGWNTHTARGGRESASDHERTGSGERWPTSI